MKPSIADLQALIVARQRRLLELHQELKETERCSKRRCKSLLSTIQRQAKGLKNRILTYDPPVFAGGVSVVAAFSLM